MTLTPKVYAAFGQSPVGFDPTVATWTDISPDVLHESGVQVTRGRADESSNVEAAQLAFTLKNESGAYTPGFQGGANWPNVVRGLPVKIDFFGLNYLENPDIEAGTTGWGPTAFGWDTATLAQSATYAHGGTNSLRVTFPASVTGTAGAIQVVYGLVPGQVYTFSAYVRSDTGNPDFAAVCYGVTGGSTVTTKNAFTRCTVTFTATTDFHFVGVVNASAYTAGKLFYIDDCQLEAGSAATTFTTDGNGAHSRAVCFVDEFDVQWPGLSRSWSTVGVTASGVMRRLAQTSPLRSTLSQELLALNPLWYYPCDDPSGAASLADISGNGGKSITVPWTLGVDSDVSLPGMEGEPVPNVSSGAASTVSPGVAVTGTDRTFICWYRTDVTPASNIVEIFSLGTVSGTDTTWEAHTAALGDPGGYGLGAPTGNPTADGTWHQVAITSDSTNYYIYIDGALGSTSTRVSGDYAPTLTRFRLGAGFADIQRIAHVAGFDEALTAGQILNLYNAAATGFAGDTIDARIIRLAGYEGETATPDASLVTLGAQRSLDQTALDLMRTSAISDNGYLYETINGAVDYQPGSARWLFAESTAYLTLDGTTSQIRDLAPVFDDQKLTNRATVTSNAGVGSAENTRSIAAYGARGLDRDTLNASAAYNQRHAEWLANVQAEILAARSDARPRVPQITFLLHANTGLMDQWFASDPLGKRLTVNNPPPQMLGPVELVIEGYTETITNTEYVVVLNCSPMYPAQVVGSNARTRVHPKVGTNTLTSTITNSATSLQVSIASGPLWTVSGGQFPLDIDIDGESITVTAISGGSSPQTFTVTRGSNGTTAKAHTAGAEVALWSRHVIPL